MVIRDIDVANLDGFIARPSSVACLYIHNNQMVHLVWEAALQKTFNTRTKHECVNTSKKSFFFFFLLCLLLLTNLR